MDKQTQIYKALVIIAVSGALILLALNTHLLFQIS